MWLFCMDFQRKNNTEPVIKQISKYFQDKFPNYFKFVTKYEIANSEHTLKLTKNKQKSISKLSIDCFEYESEKFFDLILPNLKNSKQRII